MKVIKGGIVKEILSSDQRYKFARAIRQNNKTFNFKGKLIRISDTVVDNSPPPKPKSNVSVYIKLIAFIIAFSLAVSIDLGYIFQ